jgi:NADPH2:quinone reductase
MSKAVIIEEVGDTSVFQYRDLADLEPKEGEVLLRHTAIGVNYRDIDERAGRLSLGIQPPVILGYEACGVIEKVGDGVDGFQPGDRVAYATAPRGAYCQRRCIHYKYLVQVPETISDQVAAATLLKGLTAYYLVNRVFIVREGVGVLIHAAAGGLGRFLAQMANARGALVFGLVGSEEKREIALNAGCHYVFNSRHEDWVTKIKGVTQGYGLNAVYDSIGRDTFSQSLSILANMGIMVSIGQSSGPIPPIDISTIAQKSLFLTRPSLFHYMANRMELVLSAQSVFAQVSEGTIVPQIYKEFPLSQVAQAHTEIESRQTSGSIILIP